MPSKVGVFPFVPHGADLRCVCQAQLRLVSGLRYGEHAHDCPAAAPPGLLVRRSAV